MLTPLTDNPTVKPSLFESTCHVWYLKGPCSLNDLFIDKIISIFQQLQAEFSIMLSTDFFRCPQIQSYVRAAFPSFPREPPCSTIYTPFSSTPFTSISSGSPEGGLAQRLAQEHVQSSSVCSRHGLSGVKILHLSKLKLSKMLATHSLRFHRNTLFQTLLWRCLAWKQFCFVFLHPR